MENNNLDKGSFFKKRKKSILFAIATLVVTIGVSVGIVFGTNPDLLKSDTVNTTTKSNPEVAFRYDLNGDNASDDEIPETDLSDKYVRQFIFAFKIIFPNKQEQPVVLPVPMINENGYQGLQVAETKILNIDTTIKSTINISTSEGSNKLSYTLNIENLPSGYTISEPDISTTENLIGYRTGISVDYTNKLFNTAGKINKVEDQEYYDFTPAGYTKDLYTTKRMEVTFSPDAIAPNFFDPVDLLFYPTLPRFSTAITSYNGFIANPQLIIDNPFVVDGTDTVALRSQLIITFDTSTKDDTEAKVFLNGIRIKKIEYKKITPIAVELDSINITTELTDETET